MAKIAINGFGRVGRHVFKGILENHSDLEIIAVNDLTDTKTLAHLLKYDSLYGFYHKKVEYTDNELLVNGKKIEVFKEADPLKLPWKKLGIDIVIESTGRFRDYKGAEKHLKAGAKRVIVSAPSKNPDKIPSFVLGVNEEKFDYKKDLIVDMGSCTTNCLAPLVKVINNNFKIISGVMTTAHSYTNDQRILDLPHKDLRRARAAAINIIPTTTGAAKAISRVIPEMKGKLDGIALRIPTPTVSVVDFVCQVEKQTNKEDVNTVLKKASQSKSLKGILKVEDEELVSSDFKGNPFSSIVDSSLTMVKGNIIKLVSWYDNEYAYALRLADFASYISE